MSKSLKIKLSIPMPCSEDWDKMMPEGKGRHCNLCSKTIVDFSTYTDRELLDFFTKAKGEVCGRFSNLQLNRVVAVYEPSHSPIFRRLLFGSALAAGISGTVNAQNNTPTSVGKNQTIISRNKEASPAADSIHQITGIVIDSASKKSLMFVNLVLIRNGKQISSAVTDDSGKFTFNVNKGLIGRRLSISLVYEGYSDKTIKFAATKLPMLLPPIMLKFVSGVNVVKYKTPLMCTTGIVGVAPIKDSNTIYSTADVKDQQPRFPGNIDKYFKKNIKYPDSARESKIEGTVYVSFIVERNGSISNVTLLRSPDKSLSAEAKRVISTMPKWTPGQQNGKSVRVEEMIPIHFKL